ncbi:MULTISPECIES: hypothetical protein [unclassified Comamonas]|uniref:hypothetical protein n=1 Tax=unclassified Comamonas TaxID=2638500 RepID=UPI00289B02E0|nr:hypothetical protein [Comamonas sp.]
MKVKAVKMFIDGHFGHFWPGETKEVSPATAEKLVAMELVEVVEPVKASEPPKVEPKKAPKNASNRSIQS